MNILILNWKDINNPEVGGAEIIQYELAKRLVRSGHTVTWFCRVFAGGKENERVDGIEIVRRGNKLTVYWEAWKYYRSLSRKPDKVIESINTLCWQTPLYVEKNRRITLVNQLAKEVLFYELPPPLSLIAYQAERLEYKTYRSTRFLCYSRSVADDLVRIGIPDQNISVFPLGIDHHRYQPADKSKTPLFVFVARLVKMKRADLCIQAMNILIKKHKQAQLAIVGYGSEEANILRMIKEYDLHKNVTLVNKNNLYFKKTVNDRKLALLQQAWCLLLPSVKEGWGMVVTEAAACGTPAIVSRVTGLKDCVVDGKTGIILSPNPSADELASSMETIIENKQLRKRLSQNAIVWAGRFSWENSFKQFQKLVLYSVNV